MSAPAPARPADGPAGRPLGVLLVDDQAIIGEAVRRMLATEEGLRYRYVSDPRTAVETAKAFQPAVILSDLVMPQMDGLALVRAFRADPTTARIPLVVLSSREEPATKAEAFALGANDYLVKLPDRVELVARIRYHAQAHASRLERDQAYEDLARSNQVLADDLTEAAKYVASLLPEPLDGPVRARWRFVPSASLGGDAFGYHWLDDDHFGLYLLDVSGHGVGAALLGVSVLNILRAQSLRHTDFRDPGQVLTALGRAFGFDDHGGKYFTIWYGVFQPSTRVLAYAAGGHPPALFVPPGGGAARWLASTGPMPGYSTEMVFPSVRVEAPPGSRLLLYSDGVYEIRDSSGDILGFDAFAADFEGSKGVEPLDWALARADRLHPGGSFEDDLSVVQLDFA